MEEKELKNIDTNISENNIEIKNEEFEKENIEIDNNDSEIVEKEDKEKTSIAEWVHIFILAFAFVFIIITLFFRIARVDGTSMVPTLKDAQPLVISNLFYTPNQGDIVVLQQSNLETRYLDYPIVKRIIATGGQTVEIDFKNWIVKVDGVVLDEPYINKVAGSMARLDMEDNTFTVPEGYVFVMGDNRNGSADSRDSRFGYFREDEILGKVLFRIIPFKIF